MTRALLEALEQVDRFVFLSSMRTLVCKEADGCFHEETRYNFKKYDSPYGYSKHLSEELCLEYFRTRGLPLVICNPCAVIGPGDEEPSPNGRMLIEYVRRIRNFVVDTNFSFVDVRDVGAALVTLLRQGILGEKYLLCAANWPLGDFVREVLKAAGRNGAIHTVPIPLAAVIGKLCDFLKRIYPEFSVPVVSSSIHYAKLRPTFDGSKVTRLGFCYTDPKETVRHSVEWLKKAGLV